MKLEILLTKITPLPIIQVELMGRAADGLPAFHCGLGLRRMTDLPMMRFTAIYLSHCANSYPELLDSAKHSFAI